MTEKKFTLLEDTNGGLDTVLETMVKDNGKFLTHKKCCDLLNEQHEENEFLKIKNEKTQEYLRQKDKRISDLITKKEDAEYELLHLKEKYEELLEENEQLKQALKESYINEICENCRYGNYFLTDNYDGGFEGDFECTKKHFGNEHWKCDGLTECNDFELNLKGDVE